MKSLLPILEVQANDTTLEWTRVRSKADAAYMKAGTNGAIRMFKHLGNGTKIVLVRK